MSAAGPATVRPGDLTQTLLDTDIWSEELLFDAGIPIVDVPLVSVGGGIGSFALIDYLRICGVRCESLQVLTPLSSPWESFAYLTRVSQVARRDRLRSDSCACPDNIWGFPSYALREASGADTVRGLLAPLWQALTEPLFGERFTPRVGQVLDGLARESLRIRYPEMVAAGQVRMVRRREAGGYSPSSPHRMVPLRPAESRSGRATSTWPSGTPDSRSFRICRAIESPTAVPPGS